MASNPNQPAQGNMTEAERARAEGGTGAAQRGRTTERNVAAGETDAQRRERERREADQRRTADQDRANRTAAVGRVERDERGNTTRIGDREVRPAGGTTTGRWPHVQTSQEAARAGFDVTRDVAGNTGSMVTDGGPGAPQPGSREANAAAEQQGGGAPTTGDGSTTTGTSGVGAAAPAGGTTTGTTGGAR